MILEFFMTSRFALCAFFLHIFALPVYAEGQQRPFFSVNVKEFFSSIFAKKGTYAKCTTPAASFVNTAQAVKKDITIKQAVVNQDLVPHQAKYSISFDKKIGDEDIVDANGWLTIQIIDTGDGWAFEQNSSLIIYNSDGEGEQVNTNIASWQDYPGNRYRFNARTLRNGQVEENIHGEALKTGGDAPVKVIYEQPEAPEPVEVLLPAATIFPLHYLINALKKAKSGQKVLSDIVFDGSSETREAVEVNTVFGAVKEVEIVDAVSKKKEVLKQWPMNMAIYPLNSRSSESEYEVKQNVLGAGIIKDMTLDYGSFTVKATLEEIKFFKSGEE